MPQEIVKKAAPCGCIQMKGWHFRRSVNWTVEVTSIFDPENIPSLFRVEAHNEMEAKIVVARELDGIYGLKLRVTGVNADLSGCCRAKSPCLSCQETPSTEDLLNLMFGAGL
ncbi:hypothetical protein [Streptomyces sp. NPDC047990]|uniref:hypothetical protein n=1 Tax=Streptomyces sp. NPDC047990 TaxID=3365496 RepID=UPI003720ABBE